MLPNIYGLEILAEWCGYDRPVARGRGLLPRKSLFLIFVKKQSQKLTRVNTDRNIFSINVELTYTFLLGLVHHHHRILNVNKYLSGTDKIKTTCWAIRNYLVW